MGNKRIENLAVSGNINVGGDARIMGGAQVGGNLKIDGWLEAPNLRTPCKGLFATADALFGAYPYPMPGWWALVGTTLPAVVYRVEGSRWMSSGEISSNITLPLDDLNVSIDAITRQVANTENRVNNLDRAVQQETAERTDAYRALEQRIAPLEADHDYVADNTVHHIEAPLNDEMTEARLTLYNRHGAEIAACDIPVGHGGGGGGGGTGTTASSTDIAISIAVDHPVIKPGEEVTLTCNYDQVYTTGSDAGESTGAKATFTLRLVREGAVVLERVIQNVAKGRHTFTLTPYLALGTTEVYLTVNARDPITGVMRTKQRYTTVFMSAIELHVMYDISDTITNGGYTGGRVELPFRVSGAGTKRVQMWLDGVQCRHKDITGDTAITESFDIDMDALAPGSHSVQMLATASINDNEGNPTVLKSQSVYFNLYKRDGSRPFVGVKIENPDGRIITDAISIPRIQARQYSQVVFEYVAYDPATITATVLVSAAGEESVIMAERAVQTFAKRFADIGEVEIELRVGAEASLVAVGVESAGVNVQVATSGCATQLIASGRSNSESAPAVWTHGDVTTEFTGVDWASSGWTGESLRLINGARAVVGKRLYETDIKATGYTFEIDMHVDNITDAHLPLVECVHDGKGLRITGAEIMYLTGTRVAYTDEEGQSRERDLKLSTNYISGVEGGKKRWIKIVHTVKAMADEPIMELYVDGNRVGADRYEDAYSFQHALPQPITIDSAGADIEVRSIRVYNRALSDDEVLNNSIAESGDINTLASRYEENDVLGENGVDMGRLLAQGKGVIRIIHANTDLTNGPGPLDDIFATNNKSRDFVADVYYTPSVEAQKAGAQPFAAKGCYIRIQGTSSTKYPSKNIRIYLAKGQAGMTLEVDGAAVTDKKYSLRAGTPAQAVLCAKTDYSDSSMSLNTGGAKLFNEVMKELRLLTPPQRAQYEAAGNDLSAITARTAIDGWPVDVFAAHTLEGANTYYGQYNLNNEKSKSAAIFGMEGVDGYQPTCALAFETLNNSKPVSLFQCQGDTDAAVEAWMGQPESPQSGICNFDAACEVNYSAHGSDGDVAWATMTDTERRAVVRLWKWIRSCVPAGADPADLGTWRSQKFVDEVDRYFDPDFLLTYYIWTDYFLAVDQRAKNILLRTWDGLLWYPTYYDGDTQMGKSNDSFMSYTYDTTRDTYDARLGKYAFEGRESWLWCLCLANLDARMKACAAALRDVLTNTRTLDMLNVKQAGAWCDRTFNKSGYLKYIRPAIETVYGQKWQFIFALQGKNRPHREYFVRNRFAVLDARYGCGEYRDDNIDLYLQQGAPGQAVESVFAIIPSEAYAFGYSTNNPGMANAILGSTGIVSPPGEALVTVSGTYTANDPLRIYGASRIASLDATGASANIKNGLKLQKCTALRSLDLSVPAGGSPSTGWWVEIEDCRQLQEVFLYGQSHVRTGSSNSTVLDFSNQTKLRFLDTRGTSATSISIAEGAPLHTLLAPDTLQKLSLRHLPALGVYDETTHQGLKIDSYESIRDFEVVDCPLLNDSLITMIERWLDEKTEVDAGCSIVLDGIDWTVPDAEILFAMGRIADKDVRGCVTVTGGVTAETVAAIKALWGDDCLSAHPERGLKVVLAAGTIILAAADCPLVPSGINPAVYNILATNASAIGWGGASKGYMTDVEAAQIATIGKIFQGTSIADFPEFTYFTGLRSIAKNAFYNCTSLRSIVVPEGVTRVEESAFSGCMFLNRIELPSTLEYFNEYALQNCFRLAVAVFNSVDPPQGMGIVPSDLNFGGLPSDTGKYVYVPYGSMQAYSGTTLIQNFKYHTLVEIN